MDVRKTTISIISFRPTGSGTWVNDNSELSGVSSRGTKIPTLLLPVVELIRRLHRACLQARRVEETSPVHGMNAAAEGGPVPVSRTTRRAETSIATMKICARKTASVRRITFGTVLLGPHSRHLC